MSSLRLRRELQRPLPPYIALDFDQNVLANNRKPVIFTMGELKSIAHLSKYGRPLYAILIFYGKGYSFYVRWHAQLLADENLNVVDLASLKLTDRSSFDALNNDHVLAVLSQRLCIDPVLASSEAVALADRSVAYHMRILTGISAEGKEFHTYSPSEPLLALGAIKMLYETNDTGLWAKILDTFSHGLCGDGLVETGLLGELASRILFIIARDFAAPYNDDGEGRNLLELVPLLLLIDKLFGNTAWCPPEERTLFVAAFGNTYVNYTHIIVSKDPLPENPRR